ncbi:helix-turn-helix domain-containing protein [Phycicoccus sp.]|uniref:helix-turn-helix domain-containing protein n=1 Tax=Phycicoccus sp. TaxID=1902410 RepID=UPI002CB2256B|nr:helix-turn-helix domain-containing protein [Phycicoccus sp.]HMM95048.1 helix-turn-helix domain-containing protein [Phycicoccus sp.]
MEDKLLYKVADVAQVLSLSRTKVYELVRSGELPSVRIGGSRRVRGEDLTDYVESLQRISAHARAGVG